MTPVPLTYGKIPVAISEVHNRGDRKMFWDGKAILTYLHVFPDGNQVICILNGNSFRHYRRSAKSLQYLRKNRLEEPMEYFTAYEWLQKYCKFYGWNPDWFDIRVTMSRQFAHPSIKEGTFDCPVTDVVDTVKMNRAKKTHYAHVSKAMKSYHKKKKHEGFVNMKISVAEGAYEGKD